MHKFGKTPTISPSSRFLEGLKREAIEEILSAGELLKIKAHQIILTAGEPATHLFLLLSGQAQFYRLTAKGDQVLLTRLMSGNVFGLGTLLSCPRPYIGTASTTRDSELLVWKQARIRQLAQKYPHLAENALEIVLCYLTAHVDRLVNLVTCTAAQRLARVVYHLGKQTGNIVPTGIEIEATNEELSDLANISMFTASRLLNRWARAGALTKSRGKVFVRSPETLLGSNP